MQCDHFDVGECRSCPLMGVDYATQLARKCAHAAQLLDPVFRDAGVDPDHIWVPPARSAESQFRNKAKMVVTGQAGAPVLGILDPHQHPRHHDGTGIDLTDCGLYEPGLQASFSPIGRAIADAGIDPYQVGTRTGELKHVLVTLSPQQQLMIRFVLRSTAQLDRLRRVLPALRAQLAQQQTPATVVTANLLPEHQALLEGAEEMYLAGDSTLRMLLSGVPLNLRPQGFFQTNTVMAAELYDQAAQWVDELTQVKSLWDLYCGVGGFGLTLATVRHGEHRGTRRTVWGVETSAEAITAAQKTAADLDLCDTVSFVADDATELAARPTTTLPDLVVVNPPRRGIKDLAPWLNTVATGAHASGVRHVLYSSCNATTLARDLQSMPHYRPVRARVLDMFPQTHHYEVLTLLTAR